MKTLSQLFSLFEEGNLDDSLVVTLNTMIIQTYFENQELLNPDEQEYAEDLIFEQYQNHSLEPEYVLKFNVMLTENQSLSRKYRLLSGLAGSFESEKKRYFSSVEIDAEEEKEEAELRSILGNIIEEVKAEKELVPEFQPRPNQFRKVIDAVKELLFPQSVFRPQFKLALIAVSMAGLAFFIWFMLTPVSKPPLAEEKPPVATPKIPLVAPDSEMIQKPSNTLKEKELTDDPLAKNESKPPPLDAKKKEAQQKEALPAETVEELLAFYQPAEYEDVLVRGETTDSQDLFLDAIDRYNEASYESCIQLMNKLLSDNYFKNMDTINMIRYYLGNAYLYEGLRSNNKKYLEHSTVSFNSVGKENRFYKPAKWYSVFACIKLGKINESIQILDSLQDLYYYRDGQVKELNAILKSKTSSGK